MVLLNRGTAAGFLLLAVVPAAVLITYALLSLRRSQRNMGRVTRGEVKVFPAERTRGPVFLPRSDRQ
jgi:hypothetical protein